MANGADDQWLKEDGYLNVDTESVRIVYHPFLNVILVFTRAGEVKVLDVNSGVILQSYHVSGKWLLIVWCLWVGGEMAVTRIRCSP